MPRALQIRIERGTHLGERAIGTLEMLLHRAHAHPQFRGDRPLARAVEPEPAEDRLGPRRESADGALHRRQPLARDQAVLRQRLAARTAPVARRAGPAFLAPDPPGRAATRHQKGVGRHLEQIGPRKANMFLVRIGGVAHAWNMRIHRMDGLSLLDESLFKLHSQDREPIALVLRGDCGEVMLPGESNTRKVCYDQQLSATQDAKQFVSAYVNQRL